jgi:hypothetical protein
MESERPAGYAPLGVPTDRRFITEAGLPAHGNDTLAQLSEFLAGLLLLS